MAVGWTQVAIKEGIRRYLGPPSDSPVTPRVTADAAVLPRKMDARPSSARHEPPDFLAPLEYPAGQTANALEAVNSGHPSFPSRAHRNARPASRDSRKWLGAPGQNLPGEARPGNRFVARGTCERGPLSSRPDLPSFALRRDDGRAQTLLFAYRDAGG
jgi:hypothetical protein